MVEAVIFLILSFFSAAFATIAGFGSSSVLLPLALFFMDFHSALLVVACFHLFTNCFKIKLFIKNIDTKLFVEFGLPSIFAAFLGATLVSSLDVLLLKRGVGIFLFLFTSYSLSKKNFTLKRGLTVSLVGGTLSGFFAGLIGLGGAIRSTFLVALNMPKEAYIGTAALIAVIVDLIRVPTYLYLHRTYDMNYIKLMPLLFLTAYLGVLSGKKLLHKMDQELFRKIVLLSLLAISIKLTLI